MEDEDIDDFTTNPNINIGFDEIFSRCKFTDVHCVDAELESNTSTILKQEQHTQSRGEIKVGNIGPGSHESRQNAAQQPDFPTIIKIIAGTLVNITSSPSFTNTSTLQTSTDRLLVPTINGMAEQVEHESGIKLDEKQRIAYEIICCTFLLSVLSESESRHVTSSVSEALLLPFQKHSFRKTLRELKARGGRMNFACFRQDLQVQVKLLLSRLLGNFALSFVGHRV